MRTGFHASLFRFVGSLILTIVLVFGSLGHASAGRIVYVKASAGGRGSGTSWADAMTRLYDALSYASSGDQIWVAAGTYKPFYDSPARSDTFQLKDGVAIYGGFAGTETSLGQRNPNINITILSGDIGIGGDPTDNIYHVVTANGISETAVLDGFTISGGNANGVSPDDCGGGIYATGSPTLRNLVLDHNSAFSDGGGLYIQLHDQSLTRVAFTNNSAGGSGGAIYSDYSVLLTNGTFFQNAAAVGGAIMAFGGALTNVTFNGNSATDGGALFNTMQHMDLINADFLANNATRNGGAVFNSDQGGIDASNATFSGNSAVNGGALYIKGADGYGLLTNATLNGNSATKGGGVYVTGYVRMTHATFSANSATSGGAMYNTNYSEVHISNSIFWGNGSGLLVEDGALAVTITDSVVQGGCPFSSVVACTHIINANPVLGALQNNGGFTKTMALGVGSSAVDISKTNCPANDQRGLARPQGSGCDAGAVEAHVLALVSNAAYDGYAWEAGRALGYGVGADSAMTTLLVGDSLDNRRYYGFLDFNTSVLQGKTVIGAQLRVLRQSMRNNPFANQGSIVADLATPYFGTQRAVLSSDFQAVVDPAHRSVTSAFTLLGPTGWYRGILKTSALAHINAVGTTQFRLRFTGTGYNNTPEYVAFYSGNATTAAYRPVLWIYYP